MDNLKLQIQEDMKTAMRSQDKERLGAIRLLLAALKQREVDDRITLQDTDIINIIQKMIKQRKDSIQLYQAGNRLDLAEKESFEISVLEKYLPTALSDIEIDDLINHAIETMGATSIKDMGKVMNVLKSQIQGRADMGHIGAKLKERLT